MSIIDKFIGTQSDTQYECKAIEPVIKAQADGQRLRDQAEAKLTTAKANSEVFEGTINQFLKVSELIGPDKPYKTMDDLNSAVKSFAETQKDVSSTLSS